MVEGNFVSLFVHDGEKDPSDHAGMRTCRRKVQTPWKFDPKILTKILFHYPPALPSTKSYNPKSFSIEVFHQNEKA